MKRTKPKTTTKRKTRCTVADVRRAFLAIEGSERPTKRKQVKR